MQQSKSYGSFAGQPPPPEGYYAPMQAYGPHNPPPHNPPFTGGYYQQASIPGQSLARHHPVQYPTPPPAAPSQVQYQYPVSAPYQQPYPSPASNGHSSPSMNSAYSPSSTFTPPWPSQGDTPSPERGRSRAKELHLRSRSPRSAAVRPHERNVSGTDYSDPARNLGKFNAVPETPRIGDQERPWSITLPEDPNEGRQSRRASFQPLQRFVQATSASDSEQRPVPPPKDNLARPSPTVSDIGISSSVEPAQRQGQSSRGPNGHETPSSIRENQTTRSETNQVPDQYKGPVVQKTIAPVELPATADDSSEEVVMSSTAYPGQEWQPAGYEQWMPY